MVEATMRKPPQPGQAAALDATDQRILDVLRDDARISIRALAAQLHISRASAYDRIEKMRAAGIITGYTVVVDPAAYGLGVAAYIYLRVKQHSWKSLRQLIHQLPEVEHGSLVSGDIDMVLFVRTRDVAALRDLVLNRIQALPQVVTTQTILVLDELPHATVPIRAEPGDHASARP